MSESSEPPLKKQKINEIISDKNEIFSITLEWLLMQDWFLIEFGKNLVGKSDRDLINILVLNKSISKRACPVFRHHFSNLDLQNMLQPQISEKTNYESNYEFELERIEKLFEMHSLALNPNIKISDRPPTHIKGLLQEFKKLIICTHNPEKVQFKQPYVVCGCAVMNKRSLLMFALRWNRDKLVRILLFHPKMKFSNLMSSEFIELFDHSAVTGQLDSMKLILETGFPRMIHQSTKVDSFKKNGFYHSDNSFNISFALLAAIHYDRFDVFRDLLKFREKVRVAPISNPLFHKKFDFLQRCFEKGESGLKFYEVFLTSDLVPYQATDEFVDLILHHGGEYFKIAIKTWLERGEQESFVFDEESDFDLSPDSISKILKYLRSSPFNNDKENQKLAARFAFYTNSHSIFKEIIEKEKFNDPDILDCLRPGNYLKFKRNLDFESIQFVLKKLRPATKILPSHVQELLWCFVNLKNEFSIIWYDKRLQRTPELTRKSILHAISDNLKSPILSILLPLVSMSDLVEYTIGTTNCEVVKTKFQNCLFLEACKIHHNTNRDLEKFMNEKKITMTEELFDLMLKVFVTHKIIVDKGFEKINLSSIKQNWWTENRIHFILLSLCKFGSENFSKFIDKFPTFDYSRNNNEALRSVLENADSEESKWERIAFQLAKRIRFSDKYQRQEFEDLTMLKNSFEQDGDVVELNRLQQIIFKIPLVGESKTFGVKSSIPVDNKFDEDEDLSEEWEEEEFQGKGNLGIDQELRDFYEAVENEKDEERKKIKNKKLES